MKDFDVAVVGGGLLGSAFGYGLAARGARTVVLDEGDDAIRTARGNFGLVWVQGKGRGMPEYARWSLRASTQWRAFAERLEGDTGIDVHYHRPGGFSLCLDDDELTATVELMTTLRREAGGAGYEYEVLDHAELKRRLPLVGDVPGATFCPHDGHCNPLMLLRALHAGFAASGGAYRPRTRVTTVRPLPGGGFALSTADGTVAAAAGKLIIAAGHGSPELGRQLGLEIPTHPDQGQVLVTERVRPILDFPTNYVRQTDDGNFLLGASTRDVGLDLSTEPGTLRDIARRCTKAFPLLEKLRLQRTWAALRIMTPDGFPVYQHSESHPGAFSFSCHSGVTLAANHAMEVPGWVLSGRIPTEFDVFHPRRFHV